MEIQKVLPEFFDYSGYTDRHNLIMSPEELLMRQQVCLDGGTLDPYTLHEFEEWVFLEVDDEPEEWVELNLSSNTDKEGDVDDDDLREMFGEP